MRDDEYAGRRLLSHTVRASWEKGDHSRLDEMMRNRGRSLAADLCATYRRPVPPDFERLLITACGPPRKKKPQMIASDIAGELRESRLHNLVWV